jgi:putative ABC transport system substrate-binding protein
MRRVGLLMPSDPQDVFGRDSIAAIRQGLHDLGWEEDKNLRLDIRWTGGDDGLRKVYAAELVRSGPDVLFACFGTQLVALSEQTHKIPIVFVGVSDPISGGFVESFARPGRNITGLPCSSLR